MKKLSKIESQKLRDFYSLTKEVRKILKRITDAEGIDIMTIDILDNCYIKEEKLYSKDNSFLGEECDNYFVQQFQIFDDCFEGDIYFPTDIKGQYIRFWYEC